MGHDPNRDVAIRVFFFIDVVRYGEESTKAFLWTQSTATLLIRWPLQVLDSGNVTLSGLSLLVSADDDGRRLVCRAENTHLGPSSAVEDSWTLDVHCKSTSFLFFSSIVLFLSVMVHART